MESTPDNSWGLDKDFKEVEMKLASYNKALSVATGKNKDVLEKKVTDLRKKHQELDIVMTARMQLQVYSQRLTCPSWKELWPQYETACERLRKIAKL